MFESYKKLLFTGVSSFAGAEGLQNNLGDADDVKLEDLNQNDDIKQKLADIRDIFDRMEDNDLFWPDKQEIMQTWLWNDLTNIDNQGTIDKQVLEITNKMNKLDVDKDIIMQQVSTYLEGLKKDLNVKIPQNADEDETLVNLGQFKMKDRTNNFTLNEKNILKQTLHNNRSDVLDTQITLDSAYDISQDAEYQRQLSALDTAKTKLKDKTDIVGLEDMIEAVEAQTQALQDYVNDFNQTEAARELAEAEQARTDVLKKTITKASLGIIVDAWLQTSLDDAQANLESATTTTDIQQAVEAYNTALGNFNDALDQSNYEAILLHGGWDAIVSDIANSNLWYDKRTSMFTYKWEEHPNTPSETSETVLAFIEAIDKIELDTKWNDIKDRLNIINGNTNLDYDAGQFSYQWVTRPHTHTTTIFHVRDWISGLSQETELDAGEAVAEEVTPTVETEILSTWTESRKHIVEINSGDTLGQVIIDLKEEVNTLSGMTDKVEGLWGIPVYSKAGVDMWKVADINRIDPGDTIQLKQVEGEWRVQFVKAKYTPEIKLAKDATKTPVETDTKTPELVALETQRDALLKQEITKRQNWVILSLQLRQNFKEAQIALQNAEWAEAIQAQVDQYTIALKTYNAGVEGENNKQEAKIKSEQEPISLTTVQSTLDAKQFNAANGEPVKYEMKEQSDGNYTIMLDTPIGDGYNDNKFFWSWKLNIENIDLNNISQAKLDRQLAQLKKTYQKHPDVLAKSNKDKQAPGSSSVLDRVSKWASAKDTSNSDDQHDNN